MSSTLLRWAMGRATRPILDSLGIQHYVPGHGRQTRNESFRRAKAVLLVSAAAGPMSHSDAARGQACIGSRPPSASCPT